MKRPDAAVIRRRLPAWWAVTRRFSHDWCAALVDRTATPDRQMPSRLHREVIAYARKLLDLRLRALGLLERCAPTRVDPGPRQLRAETAKVPNHAAEHNELPAGSAENAGRLEIALSEGSGLLLGSTRVTREDFERFCCWTGMDPGCQSGRPEHQADLVFYLVVFTLISDRSPTADLAGSTLLHELKRCREFLARHLNNLVRQPTATGRVALPDTTASGREKHSEHCLPGPGIR